MHPSRAVALSALAVSALALVTTPASASSGPPVLNADVTPSVPTDPSIDGVKAGGLPWVLADGEVHVRASGRTDVHLEGLQVLRADGSTDNPIASITVSLYCGGALAARSAPQPLSVPAGDARFRVQLTVPAACDGATVLVNPTASNGGVYIASATAGGDG
jgi:hypothetical protein